MWSNRESKELYVHVGINDVVDADKLVRDALEDVRSDPELWDDFERQAVRTLAFKLRAHIEGVFEDFYFGFQDLVQRLFTSSADFGLVCGYFLAYRDQGHLYERNSSKGFRGNRRSYLSCR